MAEPGAWLRVWPRNKRANFRLFFAPTCQEKNSSQTARSQGGLGGRTEAPGGRETQVPFRMRPPALPLLGPFLSAPHRGTVIRKQSEPPDVRPGREQSEPTSHDGVGAGESPVGPPVARALGSEGGPDPGPTPLGLEVVIQSSGITPRPLRVILRVRSAPVNWRCRARAGLGAETEPHTVQRLPR